MMGAPRKLVAAGLLLAVSSIAHAAKLTVDFSGAGQDIAFVGAIQRWDQDGNHRRLPDPKAKIDAPAVDASAARAEGNQWVFKDLPKGKYDLVILGENRLRIEGFTFVPIKEFDPFVPADAKVDEEASALILDDIEKSQHYENIVEPLYLAGDAKAVRVLMMLIRDKPTSYESKLPARRRCVTRFGSTLGTMAIGRRNAAPRCSIGCCCTATSCGSGLGCGTRSSAASKSPRNRSR